MRKIVFALILSLFTMTTYASTNNDKETPLYKGLYIISGIGYCVQNGQYTGDIGSRQVEITVYENSMDIKNLQHGFTDWAKYAGQTGRTRYYRDQFGNTYFVRLDGSMYLETYGYGLTIRYDITQVY